MWIDIITLGILPLTKTIINAARKRRKEREAAEQSNSYEAAKCVAQRNAEEASRNRQRAGVKGE